MKKILTINPGSTSTKIAVFEDDNKIYEKTLRHSSEEIGKYEKIYMQLDFRKNVILDGLKEAGISLEEIDAIVARGGLLKPIEGGTYEINEKMLEDLKNGVGGQHASNLGGQLANELANTVSKEIKTYIVDPVVVDELEPLARISGLKEIERESKFHALNQKAIAKRYAKENNLKYEDLNLIIAHMGGGISVAAHKNGRVIDVANALDGEGPFSPERAGSLPTGSLIDLCFDNGYTKEEVKKLLVGKGGFVSYLNTNDARIVEENAEKGDKEALLMYEAMAYQVSKEIGQLATVLYGKVDRIILTGGIAYSKLMQKLIEERVSFIAGLTVYPGEDELEALALGGLRVLNGEEEAKKY